MSRTDDMIATSAALKPWRDAIEAAFAAGDLLRKAVRAEGGSAGKDRHNVECDPVAEHQRLAKGVQAI